MERLEKAKERLDQALTRLEIAAQNPRGASVNEEGVVTELAQVRAHFEALQLRSHKVSDRLNNSIERLRTILKEDEASGTS